MRKEQMIKIEISTPQELMMLFALIRGDHNQADKLRKEIHLLSKDTNVLEKALENAPKKEGM